MTLTFATPVETATEFNRVLIVFGLLDVILVAAFAVSYRHAPLAMKLRTRCFLGFIGLLAVVWYGYASSYQHYISADVDPTGVRLTFVGPHAREVTLARRDITAVRFGMADRGSARCRLTFESRSSEYQSAWIPDHSNVCKSMREDALHALGGLNP